MNKSPLGYDDKVGDERWGKYKFLVILSSAGLLSGLVIDALSYPAGKHLGLLGFVGFGVYGLFGAILGVALAGDGMLQGAWKAILLIVPVAAAYYLSFAAAGVAEYYLAIAEFPGTQSPSPDVSPVSLFAGGVVGGFAVLAVFSMLVHYPGVSIGTLAMKSLKWSLVGGILGVIGWALGPSLGMAIWYGVHGIGLTAPTETARNALGETSDVFALNVVWQTGMALVLAIMLLPLKAKSREGNSN